MNLWKFVVLIVILVVNASCQQIIDILRPSNLLSPIQLAHFNQQQQRQLHLKHYLSDFDKDNDDNSQDVVPIITTDGAEPESDLSLLNLLQNQLFTNNVMESNDNLLNKKHNKTKDNFIKNFILYKWLTSRYNRGLNNNNNNNNNGDKGDDSWRYDESDDNDSIISSYNFEAMNEDKRSALRSARMARRSQKKKEIGEGYLAPVSVGALSKLNDLFAQLNSNIKTLEEAPSYNRISVDDIAYLESQIADNKKEYTNDYFVKPSGTAAFLHAIRSYRPSQKIRSLVAMQPQSYRGANFHDPNFLWQGLGK